MPIQYKADTHQYFLDGDELPSVTRILAPLHDFLGIPPAVLQHAADRGRAIHRAIELDCANDLDDATLHLELVPYIQAWRKFFVDYEPEVIATEKQVHHPRLRYAGTLDAKMQIRGSLYYVDYKATAQLPPTGGLQLKAYQEADQSQEPEPERNAKRAVLWLKNDGTYRLVEKPDTDWPVFLQLLSQHHTNQKTLSVISKWKEQK